VLRLNCTLAASRIIDQAR